MFFESQTFLLYYFHPFFLHYSMHRVFSFSVFCLRLDENSHLDIFAVLFPSYRVSLSEFEFFLHYSMLSCISFILCSIWHFCFSMFPIGFYFVLSLSCISFSVFCLRLDENSHLETISILP